VLQSYAEGFEILNAKKNSALTLEGSQTCGTTAVYTFMLLELSEEAFSKIPRFLQ